MKQCNNVTIAIIIVILSLFSLIFPKSAFASEKINKFGIHILEPSDLPKAQELVNSSGGDWGWVTVVIRDDDMNHDKWRGFMDECRIRHLIPLVRIATHLEGVNWAKAKPEDASKWADFLNRLNWPVKDQYVIVFNEPNHAKEWGGEINPKEYSRILLGFSAKFKVQSSKFKILNAGLDLAAPNSTTTMDAFRFMQGMNWEVPGIFEQLDGWVSHSYPNHGFLGKPWEYGKTSVRGFEWELSILKNTFNIKKNYDVFITETGWPKNSSKFKVQSSKSNPKSKNFSLTNFYDELTVVDYFKYAFENVWLKDEKVKAITPFVLNYLGELFADFSWLDKDGNSYPQFDSIKKINKISWWPVQEEKYELISITLPPFLPANTKFNGKLTIKNSGQSILGEKEKFQIAATSEDIQVSDLVLPEGQKIKPNELARLDFSISSTTQSGEFEFNWGELPGQKIKVFPQSFITQARYTFWQNFSFKISRACLSLALKIKSILKTLSK